MTNPKPNALAWLALSLVVIVLDQLTKWWVLTSLPEDFVVDAAADSLALREVKVTSDGGTVDLPGPVIVPAGQVLFVAVIP